MFDKLWYFIKILARGDKEFQLLRQKIEAQNKVLVDLVTVINRVQRDVNTIAAKKVQ